MDATPRRERFDRVRRTIQRRNPNRSSGFAGSGAPGVGHRWIRFLAGLLLILAFAFGIIPALERLGPVREVRDAIRNAGIDATALFYTESDVSGEAEVSIRDAIRYSVHNADCAAEFPRDEIEKSSKQIEASLR